MNIVKQLGLLMLCLLNTTIVMASEHSRSVDFNFNWRFTLVENTGLPKTVPLEDTGWRDVRLPHDWSVEASFDESLEGATGYLPGGVGIYQKHFKTPADPKRSNSYILFDGVYNNATFWLNGQRLGQNPYGYSPVHFNLTDHLKTDGSNNVITVHVDHSRYGDSRWYTGSGIYRNVKLITVDKLHIPIWGTFITTPEVSAQQATINIEVNVENDNEDKKSFMLRTHIVDNVGNVVATTVDKSRISSHKSKLIEQELTVSNPKLWDIDTPNMYQAITTILLGEKVIDSYTTPFGIRELKFELNKGFYLNGKATLVKGVSIHHDAGLVGAAVPKDVWRRRFQALKEAGVNAVRTAHNPFSQEFLDLCDEMGLLVQNEFFDEFDYAKDKRLNMNERHDDYITRGYVEHFQDSAKSDLTRTMLRDRNHPSVFQWSIGNEIEWAYVNYRHVTGFWKGTEDPTKIEPRFWKGTPKFTPEELKQRYEDSDEGQYRLAETAKKLNAWVKELDTTRPTTANFIMPQISHISGYADAVDIVGYSYRNNIIPWGQTHFPDKLITINENPGTWNDWKNVLEQPGVFSQFMWTGIDYMGERHQKWPHKSGWGDILDLAGFKLQGWNYFKSIWVNEPFISLGTLPLKDSGFDVDKLSGLATPSGNRSYRWRDSNMHWNYQVDEPILVEVASNHSIVELFLNGESLGSRSMSEAPDRIFRWVVPYQSGTLTAKTGFEGQEIEATMETTGEVVGFSLTPDRVELTANGYDVSHLVVQLHDKQGRAVLTENAQVTFELQGDARWLGVDNGAPDNVQDFQSQSIVTAKGRTLAMVQANMKASQVMITARIKGLKDQSVMINTTD